MQTYALSLNGAWHRRKYGWVAQRNYKAHLIIFNDILTRESHATSLQHLDR
jgi:hypothetical protein